MGRYVLSPEIFDILERIPMGRGGELQLTDAINELNKHQAVFAYNFKGNRYDIGDKIGFIKATIDFALSREDIREAVLDYLQEVYQKKTSKLIKERLIDMKIAVLGTGYVGLSTGVCLSQIGHHVTCIDINEQKIDQLRNGISPIYEPGLEELLTTNMAAGRLNFTTSHIRRFN